MVALNSYVVQRKLTKYIQRKRNDKANMKKIGKVYILVLFIIPDTYLKF